MLQTDCGDCLDAALDLKDARQATLQKSFIVPLISTAAMIRSSGCRITLVYEDQKELTYILDKLTQKIGYLMITYFWHWWQDLRSVLFVGNIWNKHFFEQKTSINPFFWKAVWPLLSIFLQQEQIICISCFYKKKLLYTHKIDISIHQQLWMVVYCIIVKYRETIRNEHMLG